MAGPPAQLTPCQIAGSQTWTAPAPVYLSTSGTVKICVNSDSASEVAIYGLAYADAASPTANTEILVARFTADQYWGVWVSNDGADSAAAQTVVGDTYGHKVETGSPYVGYMTCDINLSTYVSMYVEDIVSNRDTKLVATTSTSPGAVVIHFLQAALDTVLA